MPNLVARPGAAARTNSPDVWWIRTCRADPYGYSRPLASPARQLALWRGFRPSDGPQSLRGCGARQQAPRKPTVDTACPACLPSNLRPRWCRLREPMPVGDYPKRIVEPAAAPDHKGALEAVPAGFTVPLKVEVKTGRTWADCKQGTAINSLQTHFARSCRPSNRSGQPLLAPACCSATVRLAVNPLCPRSAGFARHALGRDAKRRQEADPPCRRAKVVF
jgi:hypothetical protein